MTNYFGSSEGVARYVADQLPHLKPDSPWTMTITAGKFGVYCVRTTTAELLADTDENSEEVKSLELRHDI